LGISIELQNWINESNQIRYKVNESKIDHNEINEITKEKGLMVTNGRVVLAFSEIDWWYGFKGHWCIASFKITASTLDWLHEYIWYILNWVSNRGLRPKDIYLGSK